MKHGFIKVAAASPRVRVADTNTNAIEIINTCIEADELGVKLIVFPELCVTGASCCDIFLHKPLLDGAEEAVLLIAQETSGLDTVIVIGAPIRREGKVYNCAVAIYGGEILGVSPKKHLSVRGDFCETRVFTPAPDKCGTVDIGGIFYPFGADMLFYSESLHEFNFACEFASGLLQIDPISNYHSRAGATIICTLGATSETVGKTELRRTLLSAQSMRTISAYIYADAGDGESTTDFVFGGHRLIFEKGRMLAESKPFLDRDTCTLTVSDVDVQMLAGERMKNSSFIPIEVTAENYYSLSFDMSLCDNILTREIAKYPFIPDTADACAERCESILNIQSHGLCKRLEHTHAKSMVIGISGGLDSCLALLASVRAVDILKRPHTDIIAVTMPCFGTTSRTRSNAERLCEALGVSFRCIDIKAAVTQHFADIGHDESVRDVVYENSQARERTQVLMDIANAEGGMVIGTGDLSELALGWATYNGDHMSMYAVNSSVPKTLIRNIVRYYADSCGDNKLAAVLYDILDTPVSPELLPADEGGDITQKTEDVVGPYDLHDFYMYWLLRYGFAPDKIERMANVAFADVYDSSIISKWLAVFIRRFFSQQFKRSCLPDGPKVGSVCVSPRGELCMPSDIVSTLWNEW